MTALALRYDEIIGPVPVTDTRSTTTNGGFVEGASGPAAALFSDYIKLLRQPSGTLSRPVAITAEGFHDASSSPKISPQLASTELLFLAGAAQVVEQINTGTGYSADVRGHLVAKFLKADGISPRRIEQTADGSTLLQYGRRGSTCVDVFPNGDVIVIIGQGKIDNVYEFDLTELPKVAELLRNAGFGR